MYKLSTDKALSSLPDHHWLENIRSIEANSGYVIYDDPDIYFRNVENIRFDAPVFKFLPGKMTDCFIFRGRFVGCRVWSNMIRVYLYHCAVYNSIWYPGIYEGVMIGGGFYSCDFVGTTFSSSQLLGVLFEDCTFKRVTFVDCNLTDNLRYLTETPGVTLQNCTFVDS